MHQTTFTGRCCAIVTHVQRRSSILATRRQFDTFFEPLNRQQQQHSHPQGWATPSRQSSAGHRARHWLLKDAASGVRDRDTRGPRCASAPREGEEKEGQASTLAGREGGTHAQPRALSRLLIVTYQPCTPSAAHNLVTMSHTCPLWLDEQVQRTPSYDVGAVQYPP